MSNLKSKNEELENIALNELIFKAKDLSFYLKANYDPAQPRVPAGSSNGGQWVDNGGGSGNTKTPIPKVGNPGNSLTVHSSSKITLHRPDGSSETRNNGSLSWRNNNPANIRYGEFAKRHGAIGSNSGFAVFPDEESGKNASEALLKGPSYRNLTVDDAIAKRSPENENDTARTQQLVRQFSGLSGKEKIKDLNKGQIGKLNSAIQRSEGWIPGKITHSK